MPNPNSTTDKLVWYVIATLTTLILTLTGAWAYDINNSLRLIEQRVSNLERQYSSIEAKLDILLTYGNPNYKNK